MPYLTPDTAPSGTICKTLVIPDDPFWIAIVNGALSSLVYPFAFEEYGTATPDDVAAVFAQMYDDFVASECVVPVYPQTAVHFHRDSYVAGGNGISFAQVTAEMFNGVWSQSPAQQNDETDFQIFLAAGTYSMRFNWRRIGSAGKLTVKIDMVSVLSDFDMYGTTADNQVEDTTVTIATDGMHTVETHVYSKNASSAGYAAQLGMFYFRRTGD